jgi:hypothetical protein
MGVDFKVESTIHPDLYAAEDANSYLKWAWRDIHWTGVFDLLYFNMGALYGNAIHYWSVDQVADIHKLLIQLHDTPESVIWEDEERLADAKKLQPDTHTLMKHFEGYVENKCIIVVF